MKQLIVLSGAGLSAPSGISTFRDKDGLWNDHSIDQVCNIVNWKDNREAVHRFYNQLRANLGQVQPNLAHVTIAKWQKKYQSRCTIITQNVDDLLERAGCQQVVHLHGYLTNMQCTACGHHFSVEYRQWNHASDRCVKCNSLKGVKPGVVFFGEKAPLYQVLYSTFRRLDDTDTVVVIGTSGTVINVDSLIFDTDAYTVLNNLESSASINEEYFDQIFHQSVVDAIEEIDKIVCDRMNIV